MSDRDSNEIMYNEELINMPVGHVVFYGLPIRQKTGNKRAGNGQ